MKSVRQRDTEPEIAIRRILHAQGLRFRVNRNVLPNSRSRADVVFAGAKLAVFIDGCFWHCCPLHQSFPKANREWWAAKLEENRRRDARTDEQLRRAGWRVERVWEHEIPKEAAQRIMSIVRSRLKRDKLI
jgi:DNA mismatch endonuclease (patch repair protein)